ncbi:family 16 glycosylhydrolase [Thaumasiovibrio sp. DFM-14]|uniref:family 16 glycosylhydrolase n=1 Tax=Thaumasiovibrio sp. DFM-14 TaxID=3384792 RepID=UPI0039A2CA7F
MTESVNDALTTLDEQRFWKSDGWANGFPFDNRWAGEAISFSEQGMTITLSSDSINYNSVLEYQSGELRSHHFYGYGCYEIELRPILADGVVTAFFLFAGPHDAPDDGNGKHNEIDIEFLGYDTKVMQINYWTNDDRYVNEHAELIPLPFDASLDFHRYAINWQKDHISWMVDGDVVKTVANRSGDPTPSASDSKLKVMLNLWITDQRVSAWAGKFDKSSTREHQAAFRNFRYTPSLYCLSEDVLPKTQK